MEAETYAHMLGEVRRAFCLAVEARGGVVNQYQGDGLQALFGHAETSEDDARRAAEAALEVHAAVRALRERYSSEGAAALSVHSGLHAGQSLVRPGDDVAGRVELFGAAPGIAKHLSDTAERDEILASEETLGPAVHLFGTSAPFGVLLKGRSAPLLVRRILSSGAHRTRLQAQAQAQAQRGLMPFVGRGAELARLQALHRDVLVHGPRFAIVSGSAGTGKTRLIEQFLRQAAAAGSAVLRGACEAELSAVPLQPVLQMLRSLLQIAPDVSGAAGAPAVAAGLAAIDPALLGCRTELLQALSMTSPAAHARPVAAEQTVRALMAVTQALARRGPLVLFIDDWQWADDATRQFVRTVLAARPPAGGDTQPLLLLAASRPAQPGEIDAAPAERIDVAPFSDAEARATVAALLPAADPFLTRHIVRQAGGNALFLEELCHFAAHDAGSAALQPQQSGPAWLETLIAARVARLPPEQRRVLDAAAVIGVQVPAWLLGQLTGCDAAHPTVAALAAQDLLFPAEEAATLRFKHGITRDVVYGALGLQARRAMHRRAAALLAEPGDAVAEAQACEALAYHCSGAGEHARAARCAALAGDKAMHASSIDRAKAQYRAALEQMDRLPAAPELYGRWRSVVRRLGMAAVFDPARADVRWFERAAVLAREHEDGPGLAFAGYWRAYVSYALGETRAAARHCSAALAGAEAAGDTRLALQVSALQGQALVACGEPAAAERLLDAVLARLLPTPGGGERPALGLAFTLACRASLLADRGDFDAAHAGFEHALAVLPGPGHQVEGSVLCLRANVHLWQGRWAQAAADAAAAERVAERVRSLYLLAMGRALGAWAAWAAVTEQAEHVAGGDTARRALHSLQEATGWLIAGDKQLFVSLNHGRLAQALAAAGEHAPARRHAALALRRWRGGDPLGAPTALRAMARAAVADGRQALALRRLALADCMAAQRDSAHESAANKACRAQLGLAAAAGSA